MPIKILMPALSPTMTEGNLSKWNKKEGDKVKAGDVIAEIETDKATMEVEAVDEGTIGKILIPAGSKNVKVNSLIAVLLEDGENQSALKDFDMSAPVPTAEVKKEPETPKVAPQPITLPKIETSSMDGRVKASPLAKKLGAVNNIDVRFVQGSGPKGRVIKDDVLKAMSSGTSLAGGMVRRNSPEYSELPLSTMRSVIARRLMESKQNVPHFYLSVDCNVDKLLELRAEINGATDSKNPEYKISVNDLVVRATAKALSKSPQVNCMWNDTSIIQLNNIDIAIAVAIEGGLITPIIRNADQKTVFAISKEVKTLVTKANSGTLSPEEFQGGSISISNLGMYNIKQFNAIVNPPQSCILAVGAARKEAAVVKDQIAIANLMNITISCDHRIVDGAVAANFINAIKELVENPSRLLI